MRYADDFIITANTKEIAEELKETVSQFLKERGLILSEEKTMITHIDESFDFLGWTFRKYKGKLIVQPSKSSIKTLIKKCLFNHYSKRNESLNTIGTNSEAKPNSQRMDKLS